MSAITVHAAAPSGLWTLIRRQHDVITADQLHGFGFSAHAIKHRIATGRLHPVFRGVYAVGRPTLTREGWWMAAVLACGPEAALSHWPAAAHWGMPGHADLLEVTIPTHLRRRRQPGIRVHRRKEMYVVRHKGIPVTTPACTIIDLAARISGNALEQLVGDADRLGLVDPEALRSAAGTTMAMRPGAATVRKTLDRLTFTLTRSQLERLFKPIAERAGLPSPLTLVVVNGFEVDFYWPDLGLLVETDGLRYHRTAAQQAKDRLRDQVHTAAGVTVLRFTHAQVRFDPEHVEATLRAVADRLSLGRQ